MMRGRHIGGEERRNAVTDGRGRALFAGLPTAGTAAASVDGAPSSAFTNLGQAAQATILRAPARAAN